MCDGDGTFRGFGEKNGGEGVRSGVIRPLVLARIPVAAVAGHQGEGEWDGEEEGTGFHVHVVWVELVACG
ncbi:hypothetical protein CMK17_19235 [Candidatus Poribacteria bacterium]|nr:hypothetical protein [Candidatus Poribacteria bacterium]